LLQGSRGILPMCPPRQVINKCVTSGATKADLWRYALLLRDIDNSPTGFNGETINRHDDFFGTIEKLGILSWQVLLDILTWDTSWMMPLNIWECRRMSWIISQRSGPDPEFLKNGPTNSSHACFVDTWEIIMGNEQKKNIAVINAICVILHK
jgi:hypothetical protein